MKGNGGPHKHPLQWTGPAGMTPTERLYIALRAARASLASIGSLSLSFSAQARGETPSDIAVTISP